MDTVWLNPRSRVHFGKLTVPQLVTKFPTLYLTQRSITMFTVAYHLFLSWAISSPCSPILYSFKQELIHESHCTTDKCILPYISTLQGITHKINIIFLPRANNCHDICLARSVGCWKRLRQPSFPLYCQTNASLKCLCNHSLPQKVGRIKLLRTEMCRKWRNCFFM